MKVHKQRPFYEMQEEKFYFIYDPTMPQTA